MMKALQALNVSSILLQSLVILYHNDEVAAFTGFNINSSTANTRTLSNHIRINDNSFRPSSQSQSSQSSSSQLNNFFKDLLGGAFENDPNLSSDKSEQQLEGPEDQVSLPLDMFQRETEKTEVQKRWLESQNTAVRVGANTSGSTGNRGDAAESSSFSSSISKAKGAPINSSTLINTKWKLNFYLVGVPDFDPSNSLYGSKVNISTRKDSGMAKDGFAIGADTLPSEVSTTCEIVFHEDGFLSISESSFTNGYDYLSSSASTSSTSTSTSQPNEKVCQWKLSDDGKMIRFSMYNKGYQRTVTTKGTIQNVYWSDQEDVSRKSSATYSITQGIIYGEASIGYGSKPGVLDMALGDKSMNGGVGVGGSAGAAPGGILKVEKRMGVFGVSSKMMACGKFSAEMICDDLEE